MDLASAGARAGMAAAHLPAPLRGAAHLGAARGGRLAAPGPATLAHGKRALRPLRALPSGNGAAVAAGAPGVLPASAAEPDELAEQAYLAARTRTVARHFGGALGVDDFLARLEVALFAYGFTGVNTIGAHGAQHSHAPHGPCLARLLPRKKSECSHGPNNLEASG